MNSKDNNTGFDDLGEQLHDQAMAERPAFSAEVHDRVMRGIRSSPGPQKQHQWNGLLATAAAILIFSSMISIRWLLPDHLQELAIENVPDHSTPAPPITPLPDQPIQLTVNLDGLISVKISPLQVSITSPMLATNNAIAVEQPSPEASPEPIGSPDWLLTKLQEPASLAQATLADLMPADMQRLIRRSPMNQ